MQKGKLLVFEGTDGSGKKTQAKLLTQYLQERGLSHAVFDFPQYEKTFFGDLAKDLLLGSLGTIDQIPAKLAVLPFACDRWLAKHEIEQALLEGKLVLCNRYTASSAVYHAAKLPLAEQQDFIDWVYKLEQDTIGLPKEDFILFFHMPVDLAQQLINKRGDTKDMYEKDIQLLKTVDSLYNNLSTRPKWKTIECNRDTSIKTPEEIHKEVLDVLTKNGIL